MSSNHKMVSIFTSLVSKDAECLKKKTNIYLLSMSFFEKGQLISLAHLLKDRRLCCLDVFFFFFSSFLCVISSYMEILAFKKYVTIEKFNAYMQCIPDLDFNIYICT